ncbi:MAG: malectin domain-containing carbohydrate-binding protein [Flavobacteriaceae bacterium]
MTKNYSTRSKRWHLFTFFCALTISIATASDKLSTTSAPLTLQQAAPYELRINSGGGELTFGSDVFEADMHFIGSGKSYSNANITDIFDTNRDDLYTTERSAQQNLGSFGYAIPVPDGEYTVNLHFAEIYWGATGGGPGGQNRRIFSVAMEGTAILSDYDINQEVGSMTAVVKSYTVTVQDGVLNLDFSASKDQPKISAIEVLEVLPPPPTNFVKRINTGGGEITYGSEVFEADMHFTGNGKSYSNTNITDILNTNRDDLYITERSARQNLGSFGYAIPVPDGEYTVNLHFAEIYWGATGGGPGGENRRIFSVAMEGTDILSDYDINQEVGSMTAVVKSYTVTVQDGVLNLDFSASKDQPKISAIEVLEVQPPPPNDFVKRINSGGAELTFGQITFEADTDFNGTGKSYVNNSIANISGTDMDELYTSERTSRRRNESFEYSIPVETGSYTLKLHFAEIYWGATNGGQNGVGKRIFDVEIEGQPVLVNYDIIEEVGTMTATVKSFDVNVSDDVLNIFFTASKDQPKISAIEVFGEGAEPPPGSCEWNSLSSSSHERLEAQSAKVNDKMYVFAGFEHGLKISNATEVYDPATDSWTDGAPMPLAVTHQGIAVAGNDIWILAGFVGDHPGTATNRVQIYNTVTDSWRDGPDLPNSRGSGAATFNDGKIHFFGGLMPDRTTDVGEHFILDLSNINSGWQAAAPMPNPRNHLSAASVNGIVYAIGGQYGHDSGVLDVNLLHAYNPQTNSWTEMANLPSDRSHFEPGTLVHNERILIVGGRDGFLFYDDILEYDPASNSWAEVCKLSKRLLAPAAKVIGDKLIVANGGVDGTCCPINTVEWIPVIPDFSAQNTQSVASKSAFPEIKIYPNPSTDEVRIDLQDQPQDIKVVVRSLSAQKVEEMEFRATEEPRFTLDEAPGIYLFKITLQSGQEIIKKVIKK